MFFLCSPQEGNCQAHYGPRQAKIGNWGGWKWLDWQTLAVRVTPLFSAKSSLPAFSRALASHPHIPTKLLGILLHTYIEIEREDDRELVLGIPWGMASVLTSD